MPLPASPNSGLGMKVTAWPHCRATIFETYLIVWTASAAASSPISGVSISHCPGPPTSW